MRERAAWHAANAKAGRGNKDLLRRLTAESAQSADSAPSIGQAAISAMPPISADQAETLWRANLPEGQWPRSLRIVSVDTGTGDARAWSAEDGISLPVAVASSTAAPGVAPPVALADSIWVDGGVRSGTNADLLVDAASGLDRVGYGTGPGRVLIVAPLPSDDLAREEAILAEHGHSVRVVVADRFYTQFTDLLDPDFIDIAATAGADQARAVAADLAQWLGV
jgi:NTE family protein